MNFHVPALGDQLPRRGNWFSTLAARCVMRVTGWRFEGTVPNIRKLVIVVAPHTSNWDFLIGVAGMFALGIRVTFLGKHSLFCWPLGSPMRWLGGVPVDRSSPHHMVEQVVARITEADRIVLGLSPEGTRRKLPAWRTGFHYVAHGAAVPILPVALDYGTRTIRFFAVHAPGQSAESDVAILGRLYHPGMARHPDRY